MKCKNIYITKLLYTYMINIIPIDRLGSIIVHFHSMPKLVQSLCIQANFYNNKKLNFINRMQNEFFLSE